LIWSHREACRVRDF